MASGFVEKQYHYLAFGLATLLPLIFLAFYKSYFVFFPGFPKDIPVIVHVHTLLAVIWAVMLVAQPLFIMQGKVLLHKKAGKASYFVFPLFVLTSAILIGNLLRSEHAGFAVIPIGETTIMAGCYVLAIILKHRPTLHMRYMAGAALELLGPTLGRIVPLLFPTWSALERENVKTALIEILILALLTFDWKSNLPYHPYKFILFAWMVHHICFNLVLMK